MPWLWSHCFLAWVEAAQDSEAKANPNPPVESPAAELRPTASSSPPCWWSPSARPSRCVWGSMRCVGKWRGEGGEAGSVESAREGSGTSIHDVTWHETTASNTVTGGTTAVHALDSSCKNIYLPLVSFSRSRCSIPPRRTPAAEPLCRRSSASSRMTPLSVQTHVSAAAAARRTSHFSPPHFFPFFLSGFYTVVFATFCVKNVTLSDSDSGF